MEENKTNRGAKSKYKQEYCQQMLDYFLKNEPYRKEEIPTETIGTTEKTGNISKTVTKWEYRANDLPTFEKFAVKIGVHRETLDNWKDEFDEFFDTYETCKNIQEDFLVQNGLLGFYPSNFAIFIAQNYTGLKQKTNTDITTNGKDLNPIIQVEILKPNGTTDNPA